MPLSKFSVSRRVGRFPGLLLVFSFFLCMGMALPCSLAAGPSHSSFALAAGDAAATLEAFSEQSGAQIVYLLKDVSGITTNAVNGDFALREALDRMVAGTGLRVTQDKRTGAFVVRRGRPARPQPLNNTQQPMNHRTSIALLGALIGLSAPSATELAAQTKPQTSDEVVTLQEFTVSASTENSYVAGDTVSGSRMNEKVKDLPYSISSITSDFIKDNSLFDLTEDLSFISSVSGNDDSGAFTVRGFTGANTYLRNGHQRLGLIDVGSVDRVELIKGPSGSIYGQTNPGGSLLITTRRPRTSPHQSFSVSYGAYRLSSDQIHFTGPIPIGKKPTLFYNIDATYLRRHYDEPSQIRTQKAVSGVLLWKPSDTTNLTIESNYQSFKNPNEFALPYLVHTGPDPYAGVGTVKTTATRQFFDGYAWQLRRGHYTSPTDWKWRRAAGYTVTLEHRFSTWLAGHTSYDYYHNPIETYDTLRSSQNLDQTISNPATYNTIARGSASPNWATIYGSGHSISGDLLAHYKLWKTDQQTLLTIDDYLNNRRDYAKTLIGTSPLPATTVPINPFAPISSPFIPMNSANFTSSTTRNNAVDSAGLGLTHQARLFHDRVILQLGYRHDYVRGFQQNPAADVNTPAYIASATSGLPPAVPGSGREARIHDSNDATKIGISVKITESLSWYASRIESFIPFGTSVALTVGSASKPIADAHGLEPLNPASETGIGYETGIKGEYLNHALTFSADVFDTKRQNVSVRELIDINNPSLGTISINEGGQHSKGFEFDGQYLIAKKLTGYVSYSYVDSRYDNQGTNVGAVGRRPRGTPWDSVAGSVAYDLATGFRVLVSMRYQGNTPSESPSTGLIANPLTGLNDASDGRANLRTPSLVVWNLGAIYRWKKAKLDHSVNVSLKNVFDRRYIVPGNNRFVGDRVGLYVTYSLAH